MRTIASPTAAATWPSVAELVSIERRGRDSNPRTRLTPVTRFPVAPVQPLRHLSRLGGSEGYRSDLPAPVDEDGHPLALARHAGDPHVGRADHEVDVDPADVRALLVGLVVDRELVGRAERDVAGGVLVEQRVEEHRVERP